MTKVNFKRGHPSRFEQNSGEVITVSSKTKTVFGKRVHPMPVTSYKIQARSPRSGLMQTKTNFERGHPSRPIQTRTHFKRGHPSRFTQTKTIFKRERTSCLPRVHTCTTGEKLFGENELA